MEVGRRSNGGRPEVNGGRSRRVHGMRPPPERDAAASDLGSPEAGTNFRQTPRPPGQANPVNDLSATRIHVALTLDRLRAVGHHPIIGTWPSLRLVTSSASLQLDPANVAGPERCPWRRRTRSRTRGRAGGSCALSDAPSISRLIDSKRRSNGGQTEVAVLGGAHTGAGQRANGGERRSNGGRPEVKRRSGEVGRRSNGGQTEVAPESGCYETTT